MRSLLLLANLGGLLLCGAQALQLLKRDGITKRNGEGVHLANCVFTVIEGESLWSDVAYYSDDSQSSNINFVPSSSNLCAVGADGWVIWENEPVSCKFSTGITFTSNLFEGAQNLGTGGYAGPASNGIRNFSCFKDNGRELFQDGSLTCYSIYYCLDA